MFSPVKTRNPVISDPVYENIQMRLVEELKTN